MPFAPFVASLLLVFKDPSIPLPKPNCCRGPDPRPSEFAVRARESGESAESSDLGRAEHWSWRFWVGVGWRPSLLGWRSSLLSWRVEAMIQL